MMRDPAQAAPAFPAGGGTGAALDHFWSPAPGALKSALAAGLASLALYVSSLSPLVHTFDPAEFQTLARTGGIAHAGYPTPVLLLQLFARIPFGTLAWRANLLSACAGACAVALLAYTAARFTRRPVVSLVAALAFALSFSMWKESSLAGVHSLALALDGAIFLLLLRYAWRPSLTAVCAAVFLFGLGLTCHLTVLGLAPAVLVSLVSGLRRAASPGRHVALAVISLVLGLAPFAYTLASDHPGQPMNYIADTLEPTDAVHVDGTPTLPQRLARLGWLVSGSEYTSAFRKDAATQVGKVLFLLADEVLNEFPLVGFPLALVGFGLLLARGGRPAALLALWLGSALVVVMVGGSNLTSRFFVLPGTYAIAIGLAALLARAGERSSAVAAALGVLVLAMPFVRLGLPEPPAAIARAPMLPGIWRLWPSGWRPWHHERRYDEYGRGVLERLEPRAVVLASGWDEVTTLRYFVLGERLRPDVDVRITGRRDPRLARMWREAHAARRPAYVTQPPLEGALPEARAVPVWDSGWHGLWRLEPSRGPGTGPGTGH